MEIQINKPRALERVIPAQAIIQSGECLVLFAPKEGCGGKFRLKRSVIHRVIIASEAMAKKSTGHDGLMIF